ncbi:MAG TPA: alkaline phosphatase family protein [Bryobacteraceae bacterium]|nr:alkaline phosphatase family protein [Bryobacteraceae bacterium]
MQPVFAYIGPGAGFAFLGSFLTLAASFFLTAAALLLWPFRAARAAWRRRNSLRAARVRRIVFLGLDGLDPILTERWMDEGKLPNFARLREQGSYRRLRTTFPALSPVAWSTFATGVSPAKHNIFDFLNRSLKTYVPELAPSKVRPATRVMKLGRFRIPLSRPSIDARRKSQSFWKILGDHSIPSTILRVPITFPPEDFAGRMLSAMCTPDLRGTQGSFTFFSTRAVQHGVEGGERRALRRSGEYLTGVLDGPANELLENGGILSLPFRLTLDSWLLEIAGQSHRLIPNQYSSWIRLPFSAMPGVSVHGIVRFLLTETAPEISLYVTPIQIDPESPALPISHPGFYSAYLAKLLGSYATAGMAEDTWALNEGAIDETGFLSQAWDIFREREAMFDEALTNTQRGVVACVFDTTDRVQHMFFRHLDGRGDPRWSGVIEDLYCRADALLGKTMAKLDPETALFVLSDHGFRAFRRAVNLNSWLLEHGYLALKDEAAESGRYFEGVDWSRTRAYCLGLSGLYLNLRGRESCGIVAPGGEAESLKTELIARLSGLPDEELNGIAIRQVYATNQLYRGPYLNAAPDLIIGYNDGYRTSWDAAVGKATARVIEDNPKPWSGDHSVDPVLVPGVLFSNLKLENADPGIEDLAPTALDLFGIAAPAWMDGTVIR